MTKLSDQKKVCGSRNAAAKGTVLSAEKISTSVASPYRNVQRRISVFLFTLCLICLLIGICRPAASEAAITLDVFPADYLVCGNVSINGVVLTSSGTITRLSWDWGDGTVYDSWFPASHRYETNGSYTVTVTAFSSTGETLSNSVSADITNTEDPICSTSLITPENLNCGNVSVTGCVGQGICINCSVDRFSWDWGDGVVADSWWPASHYYQTNGSYTLTVTAYCSSGEVQSSSTTVSISNAEDPLCDYALMIYPSTIILRGGNTSETLRIELRDAAGAPVSLNGKQVTFLSNNPSVVQVDSSGVVSGTGFGEAEITATVGGYPLTAKAKVFAGEFRIEPPILLLATNGQQTGQLNLIVKNADGSQLDLAGRSVTFHGSNDVAQIDSTGLVTALRPPQYFWETPYITPEIDGIWSNNAAVIRVTTTPLNLNMLALEEPNIIYYIAEQIGSFNYQQLFQDFDVPRITNIAYKLEEEVCGVLPFRGDVQYLVNDPGHGQDGTVPCGLAGNPMRLGTDVDSDVHNSCLIVANPPAIPQWGVIFHEMAHNFTFASLSFGEFTNASDVGNSNFTYSEGLATAVSMYTGQMMSERATQYQIPEDIVSTILYAVWHFGSTPDLDAYVNSGAQYSTINPSVLDDMISVIADRYGYSLLPRFFSIFLPPDVSFDRFYLSKSDANQATFFVAAMSAAAGTDLRADFRNKWGFPVDNMSFNQLYPELKRLIAQHEPVAVPDLSGQWMTFSSGRRGNKISGKLKVTNSGNAAADGFSVAYYLSEDGVTLSTLLRSNAGRGLTEGRSKSLIFSYKSATSLSGKYIVAVIDSGNAVLESNENNNIAVIIIP